MSRIEAYSKWIIDKVYRFFAAGSRQYRTEFIRSYSESELEAQFENEDTGDIRYYYLMERLGGESSIEALIVLHTAVALYLYPDFRTMLSELRGGGATLEFASELASHIDRGRRTGLGQLHEYYDRLSEIMRHGDGSLGFMNSEFEADESLILYLDGEDELNRRLRGIASLYPADEKRAVLYGRNALKQRLSALLRLRISGKDRFVLQLAGVRGSGRRTLVSAAADENDLSVVFFDYKKTEKLRREEKEELLWYAMRESLFYDALLCIYGLECDEKKDVESETLYWLERFLNKDDLWLALCTDERMELIPSTDISIVRLFLKIDELEDKAELWQGFAKEYGCSLDYRYYASKYNLPAGQIRKMFTELSREAVDFSRKEELEKELYRASLEIIKKPEFGGIYSNGNSRSMEDLKLPKEQSRMICAICDYIRNGYKVYEQWALKTTVNYGRGMTALFNGRPGTGKTMAAECIAESLGLPLYRINLSQIIDKYIGETEKKLDKIFEYAEVSNVLLFFDEADALFGKRSEVKDARDKYANAEVSYILARIERYSGAAILATNLIENIDEAFMRRMRFVVNFSMPDRDVRAAIWSSSFPEETPTEDIDFDYIAEKIELAGGHIKNIVIKSIFLAASRDESVTMMDIMESTKDEYIKLGKNINISEFFPEYAHYVKQRCL